MLISGVYIASEVIPNKFSNVTNVNYLIDDIHTYVHTYAYLAKVQIRRRICIQVVDYHCKVGNGNFRHQLKTLAICYNC